MFKEYDVRGEYPSAVNEENFYFLGRALSRFGKRAFLGKDFRQSGGALSCAVAGGFNDMGGEMIFLGVVPTPVTAFLCGNLGVDVTASHNPPQYNGAKFFKNGCAFFSPQLAQLKSEYESEKLAGGKVSFAKLEEERDFLDKYFNILPEFGNALFDLCGGAACSVKELFPSRIFDLPDPLFEKHSAEPKDATLNALKEKTVSQKVLGLAFDGDADRVIAVDGGKVVSGDVLTAFIAREFFRKGDKIVLSIDSSAEVFEKVKDLGMQPVWSAVGDVNVLKTALDCNAGLAGEVSGHFSFMKHMAYSDAVYCAAKLSSVKAGEVKEFADSFKNFVLREEVHFKADFAKLEQLVRKEQGVAEVVTIDGVKAFFEDYCFLVRASKTEPKIRIACEAKTARLAREALEKAEKLLEKCKIK